MNRRQRKRIEAVGVDQSTWSMPGKVHFTRDWKRTVCSPILDCTDRPVVSDATLLAFRPSHSICRNCDRMLRPHERAAWERQIAVLVRRTD